MKNNKNQLQNLSGTWKLVSDPEDKGREEKWYENYPEDKSLSAPVPGIIQEVFPDYFGVAWYWLKFKPSVSFGSDDRVLLRFGSVDYLAEVWMNGQPVGGHEDGETPFSLDVTTTIKIVMVKIFLRFAC